MNEKKLDVIFLIGIICVFLTGTLGFIYDVLIIDKSIIHEFIYIGNFIIGYLGIILIIFWYILRKKQK